MPKATGFEIVHKITEGRWLTVHMTPQGMFDLISKYNYKRFGWGQVRVKIKAHEGHCKVKKIKKGEVHGIVKR